MDTHDFVLKFNAELVFSTQHHFPENVITKRYTGYTCMIMHKYSMQNTYSTLSSFQDNRKLSIFLKYTINQLLGFCNNTCVTLINYLAPFMICILPISILLNSFALLHCRDCSLWKNPAVLLVFVAGTIFSPSIDRHTLYKILFLCVSETG